MRERENQFDIKCEHLPEIPKKDPNWVERPWLKEGLEYVDTENLLLIGAAGSGKTTGAEQIAAHLGRPFLKISMENTGTIKEGFFGSRQIVADEKGTRTVHVEAQFIGMCEGKDGGGVVLLDEFNMSEAVRLSFVHALLDNSRKFLLKEAFGGRGKVVELPDAVRFIVACNPTTAAFSGTFRLNAALVDRCRVIEVPPLAASEIKEIMKNRGITHKELLQHLPTFFVKAAGLVENQNLRVQVSCRSLDRTLASLEKGVCLEDAIRKGLLTASLALGDKTGKDALEGLMRTCIPDSLLKAKI